MKHQARIFYLIFFLVLSFTGKSQNTFTKYDTLRGKLSRLRSCYDVHFYDLNLKINIQEKHISGYNKIYYSVKENFVRMQVDLYRNMKIDSILQENEKLKFERDSNAVFISFGEEQKINSKKEITVFYSGKPVVATHPPWNGGFVWQEDSLKRTWLGVACEGMGASIWWPNKDHLSDEPDSMRMSFQVPSHLICVSNGKLRQKTPADENYTNYEWFVSYPINNYNVTLNIANYAQFSDSYINMEGDTLSLNYYVLSYNLEKAKRHFKQVKSMLGCFEKYFGKYPFYKDGYALVETSYLGMEHQSAISYGNNYKNNMIDHDYIIIHESGHEWWGNSVSAKDLAELWIHESFTTYAEALFIEHIYNYATAIKYLEMQKKYIQNKSPILGPYEVNYHPTESTDMYYKGSWMLHTLRNVINNDSLWFQIIKGIQHDFKYSGVSSKEIISYISLKSGQDLGYFFDQYLKNKNIPVFAYSLKKKRKKTIVSYYWESNAANFNMPLSVKISENKTIRITPDNQIKTIEFPIKEVEIFEPQTELFYIQVKRLGKKD